MAKHALVIANSQYDDEHFTALPAAAIDAAALTTVLSDPAIGDFSVEQMVDVGQRATTRAIESFFGSAKPEDLLVLHLSLHGWKDIRNRLYFIARDTERDYPQSTAISAWFVSDCMSHSKSGSIVLLLDCCYSGAFTTGMLRRAAEPPQVDVTEPFAGKGRMVMTASTALQFAHESEPDVRLSQASSHPSLFTSAVVQGLRDGSADLDRDGLISVAELYQYVHEQVREKVPNQTPTLSGESLRGTIYIARSPYTRQQDAYARFGLAVQSRRQRDAQPLPKYRQVADDLIRRITSGEIAANTRLPSEPELVNQYGVSRSVIRNAVGFLIDNGLAFATRSRGTIVAPEPGAYITSLITDPTGENYLNASDLHGGRISSTTSAVQVEVHRTDDTVTDALGLKKGTPVISRHRKHYIDDIPWSLQTMFFPKGLADYGADRILLPADFDEGEFTYLRHTLGIQVVGYSDSIAVRAATETETKFFALPADGRIPVFEVSRISFDTNGTPLCVTTTVYPVNRNRFRVNVGYVPPLH